MWPIVKIHHNRESVVITWPPELSMVILTLIYTMINVHIPFGVNERELGGW